MSEAWSYQELSKYWIEYIDQHAPGLHEAQQSWMAQVDSLAEPDPKTHQLVRMVCSAVTRNPAGVRHHAALAAELGASWGEVFGSILLTQPSCGLWPALEALPHARQGYEAGAAVAELQ